MQPPTAAMVKGIRGAKVDFEWLVDMARATQLRCRLSAAGHGPTRSRCARRAQALFWQAHESFRLCSAGRD
jgi:hypothetical protein